MPAVNDFLLQNEWLAYGGAAIVFLAGVFLLVLTLRRAFPRRINITGRGDSGRLGTVKSFILDPRRQLVIVRRDGVEHLIAIGGPNDVLIEPEFAADLVPDLSAEVDGDWPRAEEPEPTRFGRLRSYFRPASRIFVGPGLFSLAVLSGIAGAGIGLICGIFRLTLEAADRFRISLPIVLQAEPLLGSGLLIVGAAGAAAFSAWLVRRFSESAAGSGIPHVEAVLNGELPPAPFVLLPVKFVGGLLAIGSGFALGREGPCVQMGAAFAHFLGKFFGRDAADCRSLLAAGAGAGLAAAFNAPFAGAAFVLEELTRQFETRNAIAALGASGSAIMVARLFIGPAPDFIVTKAAYPELGDNLLCLALGGVAGVLGVAYNRTILGALALSDHLASWPVEVRAALVGAAVGALAWFAPSLAGGGDILTQHVLDGGEALAVLPIIYLFRLILGAVSYAAGTPGGLFAPLLALGAQMGFFFGGLINPGEIDPSSHAVAIAVVGMAAIFTAVVRAPLTGMILITEMTANSVLLLPMLAACFSAMAVATVLREPAIYDALKARAASAKKS